MTGMRDLHNKMVSFLWGIADDVLRDLFKRGKYPDVILPMCVLRRLDAVLEPTKKQVLETKASEGKTPRLPASCRWLRATPPVLHRPRATRLLYGLLCATWSLREDADAPRPARHRSAAQPAWPERRSSDSWCVRDNPPPRQRL